MTDLTESQALNLMQELSKTLSPTDAKAFQEMARHVIEARFTKTNRQIRRLVDGRPVEEIEQLFPVLV